LAKGKFGMIKVNLVLWRKLVFSGIVVIADSLDISLVPYRRLRWYIVSA
jgi:hypothetical protein